MGNTKNTREEICRIVSSNKVFYLCSVVVGPLIGSFLVAAGLWISSKAHNVGLPVWGEGLLLILWGVVIVCALLYRTWQTSSEAKEMENISVAQSNAKSDSIVHKQGDVTKTTTSNIIINITAGAILLAILVFIPVQHRNSIRSERIPPVGSFITHSDYPNGTRRIYRYSGSFPLGSQLIDIESGKVLRESFYETNRKNGQLVVYQVKDHTLWGRSKWFIFGITVFLMIYVLYRLQKCVLIRIQSIVNMNWLKKLFTRRAESERPNEGGNIMYRKEKELTGSKDDIHILLERIIADPTNRELRSEVAKLGRPAIESLVDSLHADSVKLREAAVIGIQAIADHNMIGLEGVLLKALDPLTQTLKDESPAVRKAAISALRTVVHEYCVNTELVDALNPRLRNLVCEIFGPIVSMLDDKSIDVSLTAASALVHYSGSEYKSGFTWGNKECAERALKILIAALDHESAEAAIFAAKAIPYYADESVKTRAKEVIKDTRAAEVEPLINALKDENEDIRRKAAMALGDIGDKRAVEPLIQALNDENEEVRWTAANALGTIGDKRAIEPLIQALKDENEEIRGKAAFALGKIGDKSAVEPLIQALKDESEYVREDAAFALAEIKDNRAVEPLIHALEDENKDVRLWAVSALGGIGDKRAVEPLIPALEDENEDVRSWAAGALGDIGDKRAVEPLIHALEDKNEYVRRKAEEALEKIRE